MVQVLFHGSFFSLFHARTGGGSRGDTSCFQGKYIKLMPSAAECHGVIMIFHFRKFLMTQLSNLWHMISINNKGLTPGKDWRIQMVKITINKNYCHNLLVVYCLSISYWHKIINPTIWFYFSFAEIWTTILNAWSCPLILALVGGKRQWQRGIFSFWMSMRRFGASRTAQFYTGWANLYLKRPVSNYAMWRGGNYC